ncbi:DUF6113 family protein [Streptomyces litchfieldiae]|uniref:DUF6113 family protein n=1 Tax=Streptomyces litchfieldiae TaxID=3075543 RepID=A0ABU2MM69_9ACTN|nr:DUF6113 family protein [Streptomyces sp. DSM 44938]MDT0342507.1 DUF6113 family protein [Streptomyces sp. DSM 44938]
MKWAGYAGLGVLGVLAGVAGSLVQGGWFPLGLLLALGGAAGLFWGGALVTRSRLGAGAPAGGWAVAVLALTVTRPQGDFIFAAGAASYLFLLGGMALAVACATLAPADRPLFAVPEPRSRS